MKVWMLCEAFTLTGDAFGHQTVQKSLTPRASRAGAVGSPCASSRNA